MSKENWNLLIGEITSPHGLHGEVRVFPHTDFLEHFRGIREIGLKNGQDTIKVIKVLDSRVNGRRIVLRLEGIDSIAQAEMLRGIRLMLPETQAHTLQEDEYYHSQILGIEVITTAGESLGVITDILTTGANDVYETPLAMIPATRDLIQEINLKQRRMTVDSRPGLRKDDPGN